MINIQIEVLYKRHALGLLNTQADGGGVRYHQQHQHHQNQILPKGWPNILTNSSTFVETSATAMFFVGLSQGWQQGWLDQVIVRINNDDQHLVFCPEDCFPGGWSGTESGHGMAGGEEFHPLAHRHRRRGHCQHHCHCRPRPRWSPDKDHPR